MQPFELNTDWLRKNAQHIHYFGLGFIQLKLSATDRLHFYTSKLPKTVAREEIHNHRYNFVSTIVAGTFRQELFELIPGDTHLLTQETCAADDDRVFPKNPCAIEKVFDETYTMGQRYYIDHHTFHTVSSDFAITHVHRNGKYAKDLADVVYPRDNSPICPFSVNAPTGDLYEIVDDMINRHRGLKKD
jgi:hypothetical protein